MQRTFGSYHVELSHRDKVFYTDTGLTKGDVIDYYEKVAEHLLPALRERPLTMERYPDGIDSEGFIQKSAPAYFPDWFRRADVETSDGSQTVPVCNNSASLVYLANQACLGYHVWLSRLDRPDTPDQMIFDLDPPGDDFEPVRTAARDCLELFDELSIPAYLKTTGSRGLHVVIPLQRKYAFDAVRKVASDCARLLLERHPDRYTMAQRKNKRRGRLYLDVQRNAYGQTAIAPYSLRAKPGAPVATPIPRAALDDPDLDSRRYNAQNLFRAISGRDDPWASMRRRARSLDSLSQRLDKLQQ